MPVKLYARCIALLDTALIGDYTVGRDYAVTDEDDGLFGDVPDGFWINDDTGTEILCWWEGDPDCVWERVEVEGETEHG